MNDRPKQAQYKFSLSIRDKHNREVKKIVEFLRRKGILSQAVRDALRLLNDLRRGNTKVLLEMFPDVVEKLCPPPPPKSDDDLRNEVRELKTIILEQGYIAPPPTNYPQSKPVTGGRPAALTAGAGSTIGQGRTFTPAPSEDDDDDGLVGDVVKKATPQPVVMSFIDGVLAMDKPGGGFMGKNHTAEANAKSLAGRRLD